MHRVHFKERKQMMSLQLTVHSLIISLVQLLMLIEQDKDSFH